MKHQIQGKKRLGIRIDRPYSETERLQTREDWKVIARTSNVKKGWDKLVEKSPEAALSCYDYLVEKPMQRYPGRVFLLRGKLYKGAWEFEVSSGDRVFYVPVLSERVVDIYYAGAHPRPPSPTP